MFRRFMIACWMLFGIAAVTGLFGLAGFEYNKAPTAHVRELRPDEELIGLDLTREQQRAMALADAQRKLDRQEQTVRRESFMVITAIGGVFAGILLLWNILCHTVRWIWMGRKVE